MIRVGAMLAAGVAALVAPGFARAYGWPVQPFDRQHAIRGAFGDPRIEHGRKSFHFGVDISAPGGSPVYAVAPGTVYRYPDAVAVRQRNGHEFTYWHIHAVVAEHAAVHTGELLGTVRAEWGHVHFAEFDGTTYVNPLRRGALEPFSDTTRPVVGPIRATVRHGVLEATVQAYDPPPIAPPAPWQHARWAPALVRWRLLKHGAAVVPWRTAADFRTRWPPPADFTKVYAPGTTQNHAGRPGRYLFWLARRVPVSRGSYVLEVQAVDTRGNRATATLELRVR